MSMAVKQRCDAAYVREQITEWQGDGTPDRPLRLIVLRRKNSARPIRSYSLENHDVDTIVRRLVRDCNNEAEMLNPEPFTAYAEALYGDASEPAASFGISIRWQDLDEEDDGKSWGGYAFDDKRGPLAVLQRHAARALDRADKKDEILGKLMTAVIERGADHERALHDRLMAMEQRLVDAWTAVQDATDRSADRAAAARKVDAEIEVWRDVAQTAKTFGPIVANRTIFNGEKVLPEAIAHPLVGMSQALYDELGEEHLKMLQMALADKPRALMLIAEFIRTGVDARDVQSARAKLAAEFEASARAAEQAQKAAAE